MIGQIVVVAFGERGKRELGMRQHLIAFDRRGRGGGVGECGVVDGCVLILGERGRGGIGDGVQERSLKRGQDLAVQVSGSGSEHLLLDAQGPDVVIEVILLHGIVLLLAQGDGRGGRVVDEGPVVLGERGEDGEVSDGVREVKLEQRGRGIAVHVGGRGSEHPLKAAEGLEVVDKVIVHQGIDLHVLLILLQRGPARTIAHARVHREAPRGRRRFAVWQHAAPLAAGEDALKAVGEP